MSVGSVGVVRQPPKPNSTTIGEAVSILAGRVANEDLKTLLTEMREVQAANEATVAANEQLSNELRALMINAESRLSAAEDAELAASKARADLAAQTEAAAAELVAQSERAARGMTSREEALARERALFDSGAASIRADNAAILDKATKRQEAAQALEADNVERSLRLDKREEELRAREAGLNDREDALNADRAKLRAIVGG